MRHALALAALIALSACGLEPMYAGGGSASVAQGLAAVDVPAIPGQSGWLVRNALQNRLGVAGSATPAYRLDVRLDDSLEALGVLNDDTISRERRILRARYQLVNAATGEVLLDATAAQDAGIDVLFNVLPAEARRPFRDQVRPDEDAWARGRGWALSIAVA